jgi:hypothetical protein
MARWGEIWLSETKLRTVEVLIKGQIRKKSLKNNPALTRAGKHSITSIMTQTSFVQIPFELINYRKFGLKPRRFTTAFLDL